MPATAVQTHLCCVCGDRKPQHQFSVATGICMTCFDRAYGICEECGTIVYRPNRGIRRSVHRQAHTVRGQVLCDRCTCDHSGGHWWRPTAMDISVASYARICSKRKFGVEIETSECARYRRLAGNTKFGAKTDCTVSGMEFDSPILYGDEGLDYIREFLAYGNDNNWEADYHCGCHTHYDMRDESRDQLLSIMYAYRKSIAMWAKFVPGRRSSGVYSEMPCWYARDLRRAVRSHPDAATFADVARSFGIDRYEMVNFTAWWEHTTFEVRMLEGTVDPDTICNWITVQCRFMDAVRDLTFDQIDDLFDGGYNNDFDSLADLINDDELISWLENRKDEFHG